MKNKRIRINGYVRICKAKNPHDWVFPMDEYNGGCFKVVSRNLYNRRNKKAYRYNLAEIGNNKRIIGYVWYRDSLIPITKIEAFMEII